jgi:hypothetical protein
LCRLDFVEAWPHFRSLYRQVLENCKAFVFLRLPSIRPPELPTVSLDFLRRIGRGENSILYDFQCGMRTRLVSDSRPRCHVETVKAASSTIAPRSKAPNSGPCVGMVPPVTARRFFPARLPAMASAGMMTRNRPMSKGRPDLGTPDGSSPIHIVSPFFCAPHMTTVVM